MPPALRPLPALLALLFLMVPSARAQSPAPATPASTTAGTDVTGTVVDAVDGAPVGRASVRVEGTSRLAVTNDDGAFVLRVERLPATLAVRRIGYQTARVRVADGAQAVAVRLDRAEIELAGIEVTGEDPARRLLRRMIAARQQQDATLRAVRADAYTRFVARNDTGIVALAESETQVYWRRGARSEAGSLREVLRAQRTSANLPMRGALPAADGVVDLSAPEIEIAGFRFVGLTNARALDVYRVSIAGVRAVDGERVVDLDVSPRDPLSVAFTGRVAVLERSATLAEADLRPGPAFRFARPIDRYDLRLRQTFVAIGATTAASETGATGEATAALPADLRLDIDVRVSLGAAMRFPPFRIEQVSRLTDYVLGERGPDSLFAASEGRVAVPDSAALRATPARGVPLTEAEAVAVARIDSTQSLAAAFRPTGPLARFVKIRVGVGNDSDGPGRARGLDAGLAPRLWVSRAEGMFLGVAPRLAGARAGLTGLVGYETAARRMSAEAALRLGRAGVSRRRPRVVRVVIGGGVSTVPIDGSAVETRATNGVEALLGRGEAFDYTRRTRGEVGFEQQTRRSTVRLSALAERHDPVAVAFDRALVGRAETRANPLAETVRLRSLRADVRVGTPPPLGLVGGNAVQVTAEVGRSEAGPGTLSDRVSGTPFTRLALVGDRRVATFARRRPFPATLDLHLDAQMATGTLFGVRDGYVDLGRVGRSGFGALRTRHVGVGKPVFAGPAHAALFAEHNARTLLWERLGLTALADARIDLIVGAAVATVADAPLTRRPSWETHAEVSAGLSGLFGLFRLDVSARLDRPGVTVGVAPMRLL